MDDRSYAGSIICHAFTYLTLLAAKIGKNRVADFENYFGSKIEVAGRLSGALTNAMRSHADDGLLGRKVMSARKISFLPRYLFAFRGVILCRS